MNVFYIIQNMQRHKSLVKRYTKWGYILIIPFVLAFLIFKLIPIGCTFVLAFCKMSGRDFTEAQPLVSMDLPWYKNFADLLKTGTFKDSLKNTLVFWVAQTIPEWCLAFWLAAMMTDRRMRIKGRSLFKTAFFFPNLMEGSALGGLIRSNTTAFVGVSVQSILMAGMLNGFGITDADLKFFLSNQFFIIATSMFAHLGITFIYAVAGMTSIPVELYEASEIDGANRLQSFFRITLPNMRPILFFIVVTSVVDGLSSYSIPVAFPEEHINLRTSLTMMMFLQNLLGMGPNGYAKGAAFCLVLLILSAIISGIIYFFLIRDRYEAKLKRKYKRELREEKKRLAAGKV